MKNLAFALILISVGVEAAGIKESECQEMKSKLGQLFYINVDGFGSPYTIHPAYEKLINKIQPGGVLPHYNSKDINAIKTASQKLQVQSNLPLMIGIDYQSMNGTNIGLGWGTGLADKLGDQSVSCFEKVGKIEAALHQYAGINNPLGPTVEFNTKSDHGFASKDLEYKKERLSALISAFKNAGLETTLKHFPYTPSDYNLHKTSKDTKIPMKEVDDTYMPIYRELAGQSGMLMTTHLFNSEVDPSNMATFSKVWMKKLRNEVGFKGLVMTDALFMINSYPETMKQMSRDWPKHLDKDFNKDLSRFAIKSILAGHDMVFLETPAKETEEVYDDVARFACTDDKMASDFRKRVRDSYNRITTYKKANPQLKTKPSSLTPAEVTKLIEARKKGSALCNENFTELSKIIAKTKTKKTISDKTVFCDPFTFDESPLNDELKKLDLNMNVDLAKNLLINSFNNPEDYNTSINYLSKNPDTAAKIFESLKQDYFGGNADERATAMEAMAKLGFLEKNSEIIDEVVKSGLYSELSRYLELAKTNSMAALTDKIPLEQRASLFERYTKEHPLDLIKTDVNNEQILVNEILFPYNYYGTLSDEAINKISPEGDAGILFKFRKSMMGMNLSTDETARVVEAFVKNPKIEDYKFITTYCSNMESGKCIEEESNDMDISSIMYSINKEKLKLIEDQKKQDLLKAVDERVKALSSSKLPIDRYRTWEIKKVGLKIRDDKIESLKEGNLVVTNATAFLKAGDFDNFTNSTDNLDDLKELLSEAEVKSLKQKMAKAVKDTWKPSYVNDDGMRRFMKEFPENFAKEIAKFPPEDENDLNKADE